MNRNFEILKCFGPMCVENILSKDKKFAWCDQNGYYTTSNQDKIDEIITIGTKIKPYPTLEQGQEVFHFRSGRTEFIKGFALLKTESGEWKNCVIYGNEHKNFVRELENFREAFINKIKR